MRTKRKNNNPNQGGHMFIIYMYMISVLYSVDPMLSYSVVKTESNWNSFAIGDHGKSFGLFQVKCSTARGMGYKGKCNNLLNPFINIVYGVAYLSMQLKKYGDDGISAYNAGRPYLCASYKEKCKGERKYVNGKYVTKVQNVYASL
jgi:soluble lytic murein transglycosylase-like protein